MRDEDYVSWANELKGAAVDILDPGDCAWLLTQAEALMSAVLPVGHPTLTSFQRLKQSSDSALGTATRVDLARAARSTFYSFVEMLRKGRLASLREAARAEAISEVLDQASALIRLGYLAAATVLIGGALESYLRHACERAGLSVSGGGSIEKYNNAVGSARRAGAQVYDVNDGKLVTAWGGIRNEAAHDPAGFKRSSAEIDQMLTGVLGFLARNKLDT